MGRGDKVLKKLTVVYIQKDLSTLVKPASNLLWTILILIVIKILPFILLIPYFVWFVLHVKILSFSKISKITILIMRLRKSLQILEFILIGCLITLLCYFKVKMTKCHFDLFKSGWPFLTKSGIHLNEFHIFIYIKN